MKQRQAVTKKKAIAYKNANRAGKSRILDELVDFTGFHRNYARHALSQALTPMIVKPRPGRAPIYTPDLLPALITCWGGPASTRRQTHGRDVTDPGPDASS